MRGNQRLILSLPSKYLFIPFIQNKQSFVSPARGVICTLVRRVIYTLVRGVICTLLRGVICTLVGGVICTLVRGVIYTLVRDVIYTLVRGVICTLLRGVTCTLVGGVICTLVRDVIYTLVRGVIYTLVKVYFVISHPFEYKKFKSADIQEIANNIYCCCLNIFTNVPLYPMGTQHSSIMRI